MQRKYSVSLYLMCFSLFLLSACGTTQNLASGETVVKSQEVGSDLKNTQPQTQATLQGTVKSVTGNEFTIETIDMSSDPIFQEMQGEEFRTKMQSMTDTERQALMTKMQEARAKAKRVLVDVTIPVGIPIMIRSGGAGGGGFGGGMMRGGQPGASNSGIGSSLSATKTSATPTPPTSKEGTIADIKVGSTLSIWLTENTGERKIASWVSVSSASSSSMGGTGSRGGEGAGQPPAGLPPM
ncbi:MAG: hypothetical protein WC753_01430 [Candidatus Gracilibacteria bacterium]